MAKAPKVAPKAAKIATKPCGVHVEVNVHGKSSATTPRAAKPKAETAPVEKVVKTDGGSNVALALSIFAILIAAAGAWAVWPKDKVIIVTNPVAGFVATTRVPTPYEAFRGAAHRQTNVCVACVAGYSQDPDTCECSRTTWHPGSPPQ